MKSHQIDEVKRAYVEHNNRKTYRRIFPVPFEVFIPEPGILFSLRLSVRPRRFVRNFVRLTPPRVFNAQERNLYHMKALDE